MSSEIQTVEAKEIKPSGGGEPVNLVQLAIEKGFDADSLEKLLAMKEREEANEARKAYVRAMAEFKKNPPRIFKDRTVDYTNSKGQRTVYDHASLGNVTTTVSDALATHGLITNWITEQSNGLTTVTCVLTHAAGHSESTSLSSAPDTSGGKNSIQAVGSTVSYLERYTLLAICGLSTFDQDTDGFMPVEPIDEGQLSTLVDMMNETGTDEARFLQFFGVQDLEEFPSNRFDEAMRMLRRKMQG